MRRKKKPAEAGFNGYTNWNVSFSSDETSISARLRQLSLVDLESLQ